MMDPPDVRHATPTAVAPAASPTTGGLAAEGTPPPPASIALTTPALPISSIAMSEWRRSNMKFRRQTLACFEPTVTVATGKINRKQNSRNNQKKNNSKVMEKFARTALEETAAIGGDGGEAVAVVADDPPLVAAIKLKYLGLETKSKRPKYCVK